MSGMLNRMNARTKDKGEGVLQTGSGQRSTILSLRWHVCVCANYSSESSSVLAGWGWRFCDCETTTGFMWRRWGLDLCLRGLSNYSMGFLLYDILSIDALLPIPFSDSPPLSCSGYDCLGSNDIPTATQAMRQLASSFNVYLIYGRWLFCLHRQNINYLSCF